MLKNYQWNNISEIFNLSIKEGHLKMEVTSIKLGWLIETEDFSLKLHFIGDAVNTIIFDNKEEFEETESMQRGEILRKYNIQRPQTIKLVIFNKKLNQIILDLQDLWYYTGQLGRQQLFTSKRSFFQTLKSQIFPEKSIKIELGKEEIFHLSIVDFTRLFLVLEEFQIILLSLKVNTEGREYQIDCKFSNTEDILMTKFNS